MIQEDGKVKLALCFTNREYTDAKLKTQMNGSMLYTHSNTNRCAGKAVTQPHGLMMLTPGEVQTH